MSDIDRQIVSLYTIGKFSEMQIGAQLSISANRVRRILNERCVPRRNISEAIRCLNITKYGKKPFRLRQKLDERDMQLKTAGVMLYWGEGTKRGGTVGFSNSDPDMIIFFLKFLRRICGVDEKRIKIAVHYYPDHDPDKLISFWSKLCDVPRDQFDRPFLHDKKKGTYKRKALHGTVIVRYSDTKLLQTIVGWISEYKATAF